MTRFDPQKKADSTRQRPVWRWRIKFFASLCLFAFMFGLMLGQLLKPEQHERPQLLTVNVEGSSLRLCFSRLPKAAVVDREGAFVMLLAVAPAKEQGGIVQLPAGLEASWQLGARSDGMQLGVVGLQPLQGEWQQETGDSPCIRIRVEPAR